jgi:DNA primase
LEIFLAHQMDLRVITLPDGLDPCDLLLTRGVAAMQALVQDAPDALEHKIRFETQGLDVVQDTQQAHQALERLLSTLATAPGPKVGISSERLIWEQQILNRLSRRFQLDEEQLRTRLRELRNEKRVPTRPRTERPVTEPTRPQLDGAERELFELILQLPEAVPRMLEAISQQQLTSPASRTLYRALSDLVAAGRRPGLHELMHVSEDPEMNNLLVDLDTAGREKSCSEPELALQDLLHTFARHKIEAEMQRYRAALDVGDQDEQRQLELVRKIVELRQQLEQS